MVIKELHLFFLLVLIDLNPIQEGINLLELIALRHNFAAILIDERLEGAMLLFLLYSLLLLMLHLLTFLCLPTGTVIYELFEISLL